MANLEFTYGFCQCGCGLKAPIATQTQKSKNVIKGFPRYFIFGHQRVGRLHTENTKRRMSNSAIDAYKNGRKVWNKGLTGVLSTETLRKMSENRKGYPAWSKGKTLTWDHKIKIARANKGKQAWNVGLTDIYSDETRRKMSVGAIGRCPSEETKQKIGTASKACWAALSPKGKDERVRKMRMRNHIRPTKPELILDAVLSELYPKQWKYVGDGQIIIGGKNPDFINVNGLKKIIEVNGDYWHKDDKSKKRVNLFKKYGFDTLIVWESQLEDINRIKTRLERFMRS